VPQNARGADFPTEWVVETRTSARGRWKALKGVAIVVCPAPEPAPKEGRRPPLYVEIRFDAPTTKELRVRPASGPPKTPITEAEIRVRP
jgi:hypothetical protein